jgi:tripeptide aminopeptidase
VSRALDLFIALARLETPPGSERAAIDLVRAELAAFGVEAVEDDAGPRIGGDAGNLLARVPATAPGEPIFLNAHVDTVPPEGPIDPVIEDGWVVNANPTILGADNKASVAGMVDGVRRVVEEGIPHAGIELVITVQEEIGLRGARAFDCGALEARLGFVYDVDGPPGRIVMGAPSQITMDAVFRGQAAHAGIAPEDGRNAIQAAARGLAALEFGRLPTGASRSVGVIAGGRQRNIVADECRVELEMRSLDDAEVVRLAAETTDALAEAASRTGCDVDISERREYTAYAFAPGDRVVELARAALTAAGCPVEEIVTGGGADAHAFNDAGLQCVNLSSGMELIHSADERIRVEHVDLLSDITVELVRAAAAA